MVLTKDWIHQPEVVLDRLERALRNEAPELIEPPMSVAEEPAEIAATIGEPPNAPQAAGPGSTCSTTVPPRANVRYLEFRDQTSAKFWEVAIDDTILTVRFGRIGTAGQTQKKTFATAEEAEKNADILAQSKLRKGYVKTEPSP